MTELEQFQELKEKVLLKYQEQYPFFQGSWKTFSSQDIQNLIGLIEVQCKQTISEKWIYTHLKPETNSKIPRKDMLTILAQFVGYTGWDEFIFEEISNSKNGNKSNLSKKWLLLLLLPLIVVVVFFFKRENSIPKTIQLNNEFTNEKVKSDEVKVVQVNDTISQSLNVKEGKIQLANTTTTKTKLIIKSPFYKTKTIHLSGNSTTSKPLTIVSLQPDDYAMVLKAFMLSDIKDWQTRKEQLNTILADNLEVLVMLKDDLGAEYFNKKEFSQKIIVPTASLKKMKILEIKNDSHNKIQFIRIKQE